MVASRSSKEFKKGQLKQADVNLVRKEVNIHELTLDELRIEVEFERKRRQQWRSLLKESARDIGNEEAVVIKDSHEEEDERWLNKYKIQRSKNSDLEAEHDDLQAKLNITKLKLKEAERTIEIKNPLDYSDAEVRKLLVKAQKEKVTLQSDLKQNEWRLDDESQKFAKAEEQRKTYMVQLYGATEANRILSTEQQLRAQRAAKSRINKSSAKSNLSPANKQKTSPTNQKSVKMLDPKKGPVKKTALVHSLPKLDEGRQRR